jgi:hypothetical protein
MNMTVTLSVPDGVVAVVVRVTPLTVYASVGVCLTPSMNKRTDDTVADLLSVKDVPPPSKDSTSYAPISGG